MSVFDDFSLRWFFRIVFPIIDNRYCSHVGFRRSVRIPTFALSKIVFTWYQPTISRFAACRNVWFRFRIAQIMIVFQRFCHLFICCFDSEVVRNGRNCSSDKRNKCASYLDLVGLSYDYGVGWRSVRCFRIVWWFWFPNMQTFIEGGLVDSTCYRNRICLIVSGKWNRTQGFLSV